MLNIAIVGHVDHGKSTLIGRILYDTNSLPEGKIEEIEKVSKELGRKLEFAYIVDALEEERKNKMTIDTTQIFFRHNEKEYAIIDAPGHKEFIKNMVTGVSHADAAVLIVDVEECVKDQTKRHAYLVKLLGIPELIVVINKMDRINYNGESFEKVKNEVVRFLNEISLKSRHVIPISAYNGDNVVKKSEKMKWYDGPTLLQVIENLEKTKEKFPHLRLPIQDSYEKNGKTIYIGNILSGELKKGDEVIAQPENITVKIEKILIGDKEVEAANNPLAVGIITNSRLNRGDVLVKGKQPIITKELEVLVFCLIENIEEGTEYKLRCVTQEVDAKVEKIIEKIDIESLEKETDVKQLKETEIGKIKLSLEKPIGMEKFNELKEMGRFVLLKDGKIIAGGILP